MMLYFLFCVYVCDIRISLTIFFVNTKKEFCKMFLRIQFVAGCECLTYTKTFGKEFGTFNSPDYPRPYPSMIDCLLYTFMADSNEIVEITFKDFNVYQANQRYFFHVLYIYIYIYLALKFVVPTLDSLKMDAR